MMPLLRFRPHHFLCALGFQGKGYSPAFVKNFQHICDRLHSENADTLEIEVVEETDHICAPCPHRRDTLCAFQAKITRLDQAHAKLLHLTKGERITWGKAKSRLAQISIAQHLKACEGCEWVKLGICAQALTLLKESSPKTIKSHPIPIDTR
jgi:hypothetical protein